MRLFIQNGNYEFITTKDGRQSGGIVVWADAERGPEFCFNGLDWNEELVTSPLWKMHRHLVNVSINRKHDIQSAITVDEITPEGVWIKLGVRSKPES
jgi:hypothetical protein